MSYPNVLNYTSTNKITIQDVRETCQEESDILQQNIIDAINEVTKNSGEATQGITPLTQNITRAMGDYWFSIDGSVPPGGLPHLGHLVSRATYGDFYFWLSSTKTIMTDAEWLAYANSHGGCCPYYSSGDGSTTFRTPKYDNAFLKTISSINGAGVYEEEGLPNIKGESGWRSHPAVTNGIDYQPTGVFYRDDSYTRYVLTWSGGANANPVSFDASRCSSVYGKSDTVTPKNISFMIGVYAVGAIVPVGTTDAEKLMSGVTRVEGLLDSKVDKTSPYITEHWASGTEWYRKWSNGWIEQGGFTAIIADYATLTISLIKPFTNTNYTLTYSNWRNGTGEDNQWNNAAVCNITTKTISSFQIYNRGAANGGRHFSWYACGY